jgi:hypothetical protein
MKRDNPVVYREVMKDIKLQNGKRLTKAIRVKLVGGIKKSLTKVKNVVKKEGLVFLDREEFAGYKKTTRLWKKKRSDEFFDKEFKK